MNQVGNVIVQNTKRRFLIGCLSALIGLPLMACCLFFIATVVFPALDKMAASSEVDAGSMGLIIVGISILLMFGLVAFVVAIMGFVVFRRARALDAVFIPLGFTGKNYMIYGRHYQGQFGGKEVDIYIYRGPTLEIRMRSTVKTRVQITGKGSLPVAVAGMFKKEPLQIDDPIMEPFSVYPMDEAWAINLLKDNRVGQAIRVLMTHSAEWALFRHVEIQPGEVLLYIYRTKTLFTNLNQFQNIQPWLQALQVLAESAENQPESEKIAQPTSATSREARQKRSKILFYAVLFILLGMPLCFIAIGGFAYLMATLN